MTKALHRARGGLVIVLTALALVLTGCGVTRTHEEVRFPQPTNDQVAVLLTDQAQTVGTTPVSDAFTRGLAQQQITATVLTSSTPQAQLDQLKKLDKPGLLLVQPWNDKAVDDQMRRLKESGTIVVAVVNRPTTIKSVTLVVGWDDFGAGERQFAALVQGMRQQHASSGSFNIEHVAGAPSNEADELRFNGSTWAQKPFAKSGEVVTKTGQTSWSQVSTPGGDQTLLARRISTTLQATYPDWPLDGVITGSPDEATTVSATVAKAGKPEPLIVTDGASTEVCSMIAKGALLGTVYRDPDTVVTAALRAVAAIRAGTPVVTNPHISYHNRYDTLAGKAPAILVTPPVLTKANAAEVLADNPTLSAIVAG